MERLIIAPKQVRNMPINASHEYVDAEKKYHLAETPEEKLKALEHMLRTAPSHKGAEVLRAELKNRLARLKSRLEKQQATKGKGSGITIKKEGSAQVAIVSMTNAGKSMLLSKLTNAKPEIADHEFTTTKIEMGIMDCGGVKIQMLEIPAIHKDFAHKGLGPSYFSVIRNADLILIVLDLTKNVGEQKAIIESEFDKAQIRLNREEPPVIIRRSASGGITLTGKGYLKADMEDAMSLFKENAIHNAEVEFYDYATIKDLAEALNESIEYKTALYVYNKSDIIPRKDGISAKTGDGLEGLRKKIWQKLRLVKVFTKMPGKPKDWPPIALDIGSDIRDLAVYVHKDFIKRLKFARIWGKSAKFAGQQVGLNHELADEDTVELHLR